MTGVPQVTCSWDRDDYRIGFKKHDSGLGALFHLSGWMGTPSHKGDDAEETELKPLHTGPCQHLRDLLGLLFLEQTLVNMSVGNCVSPSLISVPVMPCFSSGGI